MNLLTLARYSLIITSLKRNNANLIGELKMIALKYGELINVGDVIIVKTCLGDNEFEVTRVTKTLAISKLPSGVENKFKRVFDYNISHPYNQNANSYLALRVVK